MKRLIFDVNFLILRKYYKSAHTACTFLRKCQFSDNKKLRLLRMLLYIFSSNIFKARRELKKHLAIKETGQNPFTVVEA